ncbi:NTPase KAP [Sphingobium sp. MP9-4]|uniref:KAP family P-loop NTPase fold protein n=1 Tax=Sphingobium sp. MP9-4 TaxID=1761936 RepID=UPI0010CA7AFB|nr:P-loop NTPase fold protein [Sphingobium sp. MP9-4]TKV35563.1 NTPase KAP [Sphingobium sp. MP9-4]
MTTNSFHGDRPIEGPEQDRFCFGPLADRIAEALTTQAAGKGFVLGVEGKWGSGKSSLLALVVAKLRGMDQSKVAVVEFRPWLVGDRDQLLASLFEDLVKAIAGLEHAGGDATGTSMITAKEVSEKARRFAGHLGPVGKLAGLAGLAIPGAAIIGTVLEGLAAAAKDASEGPTLAAQKDDLSAALVKLDCRIVVTIDDVDRLEPREVGELLRLVRSVADFPNVSYLLCYDATILKHAVEKATGVGDGSAYLEKIVQTEIGVPLPESFALRRWFTAELKAFAECDPRRVPDLLHVIDETGGRGFDTARSVVRVLDSLRAYWPSINGRVDLVDLVWLRIIAVTEPALYRWIEEYLTAYAALAAGRVHISEAERNALAKRMDDALAAEGLDWKRMQFELERHLPGLNFHNFNQGKEERLFSKAQRGAHAQDFERARLASPSHSRLYFTLTEPADSVTDTDVAELLEAANGGMNDVAALFLRLSEKRGDAGATKTERLLDQLASFDEEIVQGWPVEVLTLGLVNVADELAKDEAGDDWGYPRIWHLAGALLKRLSRVLPEQQWKDLVERLFTEGQSLGFISHLLRNETFSHGFYGDRPDASDAITDRATFDAVRSIMVRRYAAGGLDRILAERNAITILYAWSQAGGRDEVVKAVAERTAEDGAFVEFMLKVCSTSVSSSCANLSLSLEAIHNFFDSPPEVVDRLLALEKREPPEPGAGLVTAAISRSTGFNGLSIHDAAKRWRDRQVAADPAEATAATEHG